MKKIIILGCLIICFYGCYNDSFNKLYPIINTCDTTNVYYATDIKPIFDQYCNTAPCHSATGSSGFDFTDTMKLKTEALNGDVVTDINFTPNTSHHNNMPLGGTKLPMCSIDKITRWIHMGANFGTIIPPPCDTTIVSFTNDIKPILAASCNISVGCHAVGSTNGYDFVSDTSILQMQATNGNIVSDINFAPTTIHHNNMPLGGNKLPQCSINKFTRWVNLGANCSN